MNDKVVLITGAGSGFGKLVAGKCAAGGKKVVGIDIDPDNLNKTFEVLREAGFQAAPYVADVTEISQVRAAIGQAPEQLRVDVLVNDAGVMPLAFFADHERTWAKWHKATDISNKGVVNGIAAVYD